jgi:hypothetical protein
VGTANSSGHVLQSFPVAHSTMSVLQKPSGVTHVPGPAHGFASDQKPVVQSPWHVRAARSARRRRAEFAAAASAFAAASAVCAAVSYVPSGGVGDRTPHVGRPQMVGAGVGGTYTCASVWPTGSTLMRRRCEDVGAGAFVG